MESISEDLSKVASNETSNNEIVIDATTLLDPKTKEIVNQLELNISIWSLTQLL